MGLGRYLKLQDLLVRLQTILSSSDDATLKEWRSEHTVRLHRPLRQDESENYQIKRKKGKGKKKRKKKELGVATKRKLN